MKMKKSIAVVLGVALATVGSGHAAVITFSGPVVATNTSVLDVPWLAGSLFVEGSTFGSGAKSFTTAGGQSISLDGGSSLGNADMPVASPSATSGFYNAGTQWNNSILTDATDLLEWTDSLKGNLWHNDASDAVRPLALHLAGLSVGQEYSVSLFAVDQRAGDSQTRSQRYWSGFESGNFAGGSSASFSTTNATMVIGTFVADATYQDIFLQETDGIGNDDTTLAVYTLYSVPEPGGLGLVGLASVGLLGLRRRLSR